MRSMSSVTKPTPIASRRLGGGGAYSRACLPILRLRGAGAERVTFASSGMLGCRPPQPSLLRGLRATTNVIPLINYLILTTLIILTTMVYCVGRLNN